MRVGVIAALAIAGATLMPGRAQAGPAPLPLPYVGAYQPRGTDEAGWWREDDEFERRLAASPVVIDDEGLRSYVRSVLCDTVGEDRCRAVRIYVLRDPTFNATMSPNGTLRVYSGLLLRVRSEAELGAVLGHEFGHFERRHFLERFRAGRTGTDILAWSSLLASMVPSYESYRAYRDLELSIYGHLFRYKRDQEREADLLGLGYLNASNLRPQAASEIWQSLMAELEISANVRGLRKPNFDRVAFTASHPPEGERAAYLAELALPDGAIRDDGASRYREVMARWLPQFLEDQIKLNDFGASEYIINRLAEDGWTAWLWHARGELYRSRGHPRDLTHAAEFYANAIALDPSLAEAHRGLGLSLLKTGERTAGIEALRRYLDLAPDASDAGMIRLMVPQEAGTQ